MEALESLDRFVRETGLDDELCMLEKATGRLNVDPQEALEYRVAREAARAIMKRGCRLWDIESVTVFRSPGTAEGVLVEIKYGDSVVEPLLTK